MKIIRWVKNFFFDPRIRLDYLTKLGFTHHMSDEKYIKKKFKLSLGYELDLENPKTFNEKLQWLKLHDRKPEYTIMVDKYRVREYIAEKIGEEYLIPLLGVWDDPDDIDFDKLPDQFVLKCNHNSGSNFICRDKSKFDIKKAKRKLKKLIKEQYYYKSREWPYKNVQRKITAEKYMGDRLIDYKFYCFNGIPEVMLIVCDRQNESSETTYDYYDMNFNHLPFVWGGPQAIEKIKCPSLFNDMKEIAKVLSYGIPHIRVDLYNLDGKIYFGELTFFDAGGFAPFDKYEYDLKLGEMITLPEK